MEIERLMTEEQRRQGLSQEALIAVLEERLSAHNRQMMDGFAAQRVAMSELNGMMRALEARERERNGQIKELANYRIENEQHWGEHMRQASADSAELQTLVIASHDGQVVRGVWQKQLGFFVAGLSTASIVVGILVSVGLIS